jgi:hypothetical protein
VRSVRPPFCTLLGYDPEVLAKLHESQVNQLDSLSQAWLLSAVLFGYPLGVALWMVEHSLILSTLTALGTSLLVVNLLRLITSGSGTAPEHRLSRRYRPSLLPVALLLGLALILSQPAQLLTASKQTLTVVAQHRDALKRAHLEAQLAISGVGADAFTQQLDECEFVLLRLRLLWANPVRAVLWTFFYLALTLSPALLARVLWLDAVVAYERARHRTQRAKMFLVERQGRRLVDQALRPFATYQSEALRRLGPPLDQTRARELAVSGGPT